MLQYPRVEIDIVVVGGEFAFGDAWPGRIKTLDVNVSPACDIMIVLTGS
jgi:hypothetical protein